MSLQKFTIPFFVFVTGACVLIIEILAMRILAPYYGNTIFTVSGVISVVLLALSLGYFSGGRLADQYPHERIFYSIIAMAGVITIFLQLAGIVLLPLLGYEISLIYGPLIFSGALFFLPNYLLAMLSPFAIKLQKIRLPESDIGKISGQIFFWSTLGSIFGSISVGFFLIPYFGINAIMFGLGFVLLVLGTVPLVNQKRWPKLLLAVIVLLSFPWAAQYFSLQSLSFLHLLNGVIVHSQDSLYQKITILDGHYRERPARFLIQDRNSSAAQFLDSNNPNDLVFDYTKYYILYQIFNPEVRRALMIGGGAYSVPKSLLKDLPQVTVDVAEIDPLIFQLDKKYFGVSDDVRLHNFVEDGRRLLHDSDTKYDFIFSDAYASYLSTPDHLTTKEFFQLAHDRLNDNGVFIGNVVGSLSARPHNFLFSEMRTFKSVFANSYFFAVTSPQSSKVQNTIFVGFNGKKAINFNAAEVAKNKNDTIRNLSQKIINPDTIFLSHYSLLTDNFAPVEYLMSKELGNLQ